MNTITLQIHFLAANEGGRRDTLDPRRGGYSPHLSVAPDGELLGVRLLPAETSTNFDPRRVVVEAELLYQDVDYSVLQPGVQFKVVEGRKVVGEEIVVEK